MRTYGYPIKGIARKALLLSQNSIKRQYYCNTDDDQFIDEVLILKLILFKKQSHNHIITVKSEIKLIMTFICKYKTKFIKR